MPLVSRKKHRDPPPANRLASQSTQQPEPVCKWSAHAPQCGLSPSPFPRFGHTLTATATATGEVFLFGGFTGHSYHTSSDVYVFSTRDFSATLLQTSGEAPTPRARHGAALIDTTLLICGGVTDFGHRVLNHDLLYLLDLGTSDLLISSPTPVDHSFLRSSIKRVVPRCAQWSRTGRSLPPNNNRGRYQALRLRWSG